MDQETAKPMAAVLDEEDLLERCLGNLEFAERVLAKFQTQCQADLAALEQASATGDTEQVASLAHRMMGASANAAAVGIREQAAGIERAARHRCVEEIPSRMENLKREWSRFALAASRLAWPPDSTY